MKALCEWMFKKKFFNFNTSSQENHVRHEQRPISFFHDCTS
jgi:hypothetical protein